MRKPAWPIILIITITNACTPASITSFYIAFTNNSFSQLP